MVTGSGRGEAAHAEALTEQRGGLVAYEEGGLRLHTGVVSGLDTVRLPPGYEASDCRNNRVAELAVQTDGFLGRVREAISRYGADRVGLFVATSTAGMRETEAIYRSLPGDRPVPADFPLDTTHRPSATTRYLRHRLGLSGVSQSISTACSSSAKVFASAARHMAAGLCDAAVVGGVDSLCRTTLFGFHALGLTSSGLCRPFSGDRDGLCLGEAGALALLEGERAESGSVALLGYGESTDAHNMSTPHPEAVGARLAMRRALERAQLPAEAIDYVNLHGTATPINDRAEDLAVVTELGTAVPVSSTKGWTGHTLGAAGAVEALFAAMTLKQGVAPGTLNTTSWDEALQANLLVASQAIQPRYVMSNSFGFGGNNAVLILGVPA
jgi:3-oxoacyl-[acyl-carrier-protein] synthase-1